MADDEILGRIEAHMQRGNKLMDRGNQLMAEVRHEIELNRAAHERNTVAFEGVMDAIADVRAEFQTNREFFGELYGDLRHFIRDTVRRNEQVLGQLIEGSRANTRAILSRLPPAAA